MVKVNVARSPEEADLQAQGVDVLSRCSRKRRRRSLPKISLRLRATKRRPKPAKPSPKPKPKLKLSAEGIATQLVRGTGRCPLGGGLFRCAQRFVAKCDRTPERLRPASCLASVEQQGRVGSFATWPINGMTISTANRTAASCGPGQQGQQTMDNQGAAGSFGGGAADRSAARPMPTEARSPVGDDGAGLDRQDDGTGGQPMAATTARPGPARR